MPDAPFGPWSPDIGEVERVARLRAMRALSLLLCGASHSLTTELRTAERDAAAAERALAELDALPPLRRRRLLSAYLAVAR
jgi:hypothetical protein